MSFWKALLKKPRLKGLTENQALTPRDLVPALLALFMYTTLYVSKADVYVYLYFKPHQSGLFHHLSSFVSSLGSGEVLFFFIFLLLVLPANIPKRREAFGRGLLGLTMAGLVSLAIKVFLGRPRPSLLLSGHYWPHGPTLMNKFFSTPSGHTTAAFALACIFSHFFPRGKHLFKLGALMIGLSRVVLLYHYPSDIIISISIGCLLGKWASTMKLPEFVEGYLEG